MITVLSNKTGVKTMETLNASPLGEKVRKHYKALAEAKELEIGKALALSANDYDVAFLVDICNEVSKAPDMAIMVFLHENVGMIEVCRVENEVNTKTAYRHMQADKLGDESGPTGAAYSYLLDAVRKYVNLAANEVKSYDAYAEKYKGDNIISYGYLHKKLVRSGPFKNSQIGATKQLHKSVNDAIEANMLIEMAKDHTIKHYGMSARMFKIVVPNVMGATKSDE